MLVVLLALVGAYLGTGAWRRGLMEESARSRRVIAAVERATAARQAERARQEVLESTLQARPEEVTARLELAGLRWQEAGPGAAAAVLEAAPQPAGDPRLARTLAAAQRGMGREDRALATLDEAIGRMPTNGDLLAERGLLFSLLGWFPQAAADLRAAAQHDADPLQLAIARATMARQQKDLRGARRELEEARARYPEEAELVKQLAALAETERRFDEAARLLESIASVEEDPDVWVALARVRLGGSAARAIVEARASAERALALRPEMPAARLLVARCRRWEGNAAGALVILERLYSERPQLPGLAYEMAQAYRSVGRTGDAARKMEQHEAAFRHRERMRRAAMAVMTRPDDALAQREMGRLCLEQGRLGRAILSLERAAALNPRLPGVAELLQTARAATIAPNRATGPSGSDPSDASE
jgi:tetratricopeptide (TPR) repeat protein